MRDFERIYQLGNEQRYSEALAEIYNLKIKDINEQYKFDENQAWFIVANLFAELKQFDHAKRAYIKAIEIESDDVDAYLGLSNILNKEKNYSEAIEWLKKGLAVIQDDRLIYNYANNLFDQGDFLNAIEQYQKVSQNNPDLYQFAQKNLTTATQNLISLQS